MLSEELKKDAEQIGCHIVNGDLNVASRMFSEKLTGLKHLEAIALKDAIHEFVDRKTNETPHPHQNR